MAKVYQLRPQASRAKSAKDAEAQRVLSCVDQAHQTLSHLHSEWNYYVHFIRGHQWTYLDPHTGSSQYLPAVPWRMRIVDNQTLPLILHMQALLLRARPTYRAMPRTEEEEDFLAALGYESMLSYDWDRLGLSQELSNALLWTLVTGNSFWRVSWNPYAGKALMVPGREGESLTMGKDGPGPEEDEGPDEESEESEEEQFTPPSPEMFGLEGGGMPVREAEVFDEIVYEGDVDIQTLSPFNFGVDLAATSLRRAAYCWQEAFIHRDVLRDRIGKRADEMISDVTFREWSAYDRHLRFDQTGTAFSTEDFREQVRVTEFWEAPTKKHPKGRTITVAGGQTLYAKDNAYGGRFPFVHFGAIKVPGRFWCDGPVRYLIDLQQNHNRALTRYMEFMQSAANPKVIADVGALPGDTSWNDRPGEIVFKKRGYQVEVQPAPAAPSIHPQIMSLAMNSMQSITGINDPLAGQNPPNVRAAATVRFLQEAGMQRFTPLALQVEEALRDAGRMLLYLHKRFYTEERFIRVLGSDGKPCVHHMGKAQIERVEDVTLEHGSMLPKSSAAQQEMLIQVMQFAPFLFADEAGKVDREHILRILDMPTATGRVTPHRQQRMRAYQEHVDLANGIPIEVQPWDDDEIHMQIHGSKLSSPGYVEERTEEAKNLAAHFARHEVQRQMKMTGQMVNIHGPSSPGGPPGSGAVPPLPPPGGSGIPSPPGGGGGAGPSGPLGEGLG